VTAQDGSVVYKTEADPIPLSFSQYSRDIVREGMRAAITDPHASAYSEFLDSPVAVAGKTGTAETNYGEGQIQTNGLFICFAPYDDPEIAVAVAAESGARGAGVSSVAAAMIKAYYSNPDADQQSVQPGLQ
jgi:penicillin-binding protein 2